MALSKYLLSENNTISVYHLQIRGVIQIFCWKSGNSFNAWESTPLCAVCASYTLISKQLNRRVYRGLQMERSQPPSDVVSELNNLSRTSALYFRNDHLVLLGYIFRTKINLRLKSKFLAVCWQPILSYFTQWKWFFLLLGCSTVWFKWDTFRESGYAHLILIIQLSKYRTFQNILHITILNIP